jgi:hypothetical protein
MGGVAIFKISELLGYSSDQQTVDTCALLQAHDAVIDRFRIEIVSFPYAFVPLRTPLCNDTIAHPISTRAEDAIHQTITLGVNENHKLFAQIPLIITLFDIHFSNNFVENFT